MESSSSLEDAFKMDFPSERISNVKRSPDSFRIGFTIRSSDTTGQLTSTDRSHIECKTWYIRGDVVSGANLSGIETFFNARSVAIYGASASPNSVGQAIIQNFIKPQYTGKVYGVNPMYTTILGVPCYPSLQEIPESVDLVVVAVPARITPRIFEDIDLLLYRRI